MNHEEAQVRMNEVQRIMERTTLYTLLPGASAIIGGILTGIIKILKDDSGKHGKKLNAEQAQMMQELNRGFQQMEKRIEALETIMLEKHKSDQFDKELRGS